MEKKCKTGANAERAVFKIGTAHLTAVSTRPVRRQPSQTQKTKGAGAALFLYPYQQLWHCVMYPP